MSVRRKIIVNKIDICGGGIEYSLPFGGVVRKFNNGHKAYFMYAKNQHYILHISDNFYKYRLEIILLGKGAQEKVSFYQNGQSIREVFKNIRKELNIYRRLLNQYNNILK